MKKFRKILTLAVAFAMIMMISGCVGGGELTGIEGKYVAIAGEMIGVSMGGDEIAGWNMELAAGGKGNMEVEGEKGRIKWTLDGDAISVKVQGEEFNGSVNGDVITFEDVMGTGVKLTLAKEGSEAATDPSYALSDDEKAMVGAWRSDEVYDVMEEDASEEIDPYALTMELNADKSAVINYKGEDLGEQKWSVYSGTGNIEDLDITWDVNEDGSIKVTYFEGEDYYYFHCVK